MNFPVLLLVVSACLPRALSNPQPEMLVSERTKSVCVETAFETTKIEVVCPGYSVQVRGVLGGSMGNSSVIRSDIGPIRSSPGSNDTCKEYCADITMNPSLNLCPSAPIPCSVRFLSTAGSDLRTKPAQLRIPDTLMKENTVEYDGTQDCFRLPEAPKLLEDFRQKMIIRPSGAQRCAANLDVIQTWKDSKASSCRSNVSRVIRVRDTTPPTDSVPANSSRSVCVFMTNEWRRCAASLPGFLTPSKLPYALGHFSDVSQLRVASFKCTLDVISGGASRPTSSASSCRYDADFDQVIISSIRRNLPNRGHVYSVRAKIEDGCGNVVEVVNRKIWLPRWASSSAIYMPFADNTRGDFPNTIGKCQRTVFVPQPRQRRWD